MALTGALIIRINPWLRIYFGLFSTNFVLNLFAQRLLSITYMAGRIITDLGGMTTTCTIKQNIEASLYERNNIDGERILNTQLN